MLNKSGFRLNVGIILANSYKELFWGRRLGKKDTWQFPQGGIQGDETPEEAMYRELYEEIGLYPKHVKILGQTQGWLSYHLPRHLQRSYQKPLCVGQRQKWFLLQLITDENEKVISFNHTPSPEFTAWQWVEYWHPLNQVISFKKEVYRSALKEFESLLKIGPNA